MPKFKTIMHILGSSQLHFKHVNPAISTSLKDTKEDFTNKSEHLAKSKQLYAIMILFPKFHAIKSKHWHNMKLEKRVKQ